MESSSSVPGMSSRKTLRKGQQDIVAAALEKRRGILTGQLPTGYGKTMAAAQTYAELREAGVVNRLLYIVSTEPQRTQFIRDAEQDFEDAGLVGVQAIDVGQAPTLALREHRRDESHVFTCTIQGAASANTGNAVKDLLQTGRWMVVVDEYHHYGIDLAWGRTIRDLNYEFLLAMSATPNRRDGDSAFGQPTVVVPYLDALEEQAVKKLVLHSYEYRVDAITVNGRVITFSTTDLFNEVGSSDPEAIDRYLTTQKLRWSPKYISPLVSIPVERLLTRRCETHVPLQMIVGAMGCQHASMVCEQIKAMFGDVLRIDWVGTGPNGRPDEENKEILQKFCPRKRSDGLRNPDEIELDILVHVGMAGEGLDAVYVTEVVHLNPATITNQNDQENGRASRWMPGIEPAQQVAYINVDSASPYAQWAGTRIMALFDAPVDALPPDDEPVPDGVYEPGEYRELPNEPFVYIAECELTHIDKGDREVQKWAGHIADAYHLDGAAILRDPSHPDYELLMSRAVEARRQEFLARARGMDRMSALAQLQRDLNAAVGKVAYLAVRKTVTGRFEKTLIGDMKRRISSELCRQFRGQVKDANEEGLRHRYAWVKSIEQALLREEMPVWLA